MCPKFALLHYTCYINPYFANCNLSRDSPNLWYSPPSPQPQPTVEHREPFHHSRSVFEERKNFYDNLSRSNVPRAVVNHGSNNPAVLHLSPSHDPDTDIQYRQKKVVNELNQRQSQMPPPPPPQQQQQQANGGRYAVPEPDYSPPMPRVNPFELRRATAKTGF